MATYKVIQDIEAEDKFLGPMTLKQFIFGAMSALFLYISFFAVTKGATFLLAVFLPPAALAAFLAIPWSSDQPTETWVLAKLRYRLKPKVRLWDQAGLEQLVTITAPKKEEKQLTNELDQTEVKSRLKALAETIDTRGWAVKNATGTDAYVNRNTPQAGERLVNPDMLPKEVPGENPSDYTDVLDTDNAVSENFSQLIEQSTNHKRMEAIDKMKRIRRGEPLDSEAQQIGFIPPRTSMNENTLSQQLRNSRRAGNISTGNMQKIPVAPVAPPAPIVAPPAPVETVQAPAVMQPDPEPQAEMTSQTDPAILTLVHEDEKSRKSKPQTARKNDLGDNEVVISLH